MPGNYITINCLDGKAAGQVQPLQIEPKGHTTIVDTYVILARASKARMPLSALWVWRIPPYWRVRPLTLSAWCAVHPVLAHSIPSGIDD